MTTKLQFRYITILPGSGKVEQMNMLKETYIIIN